MEQKSGDTSKILLVDDHPTFRQGLRAVIDHLDAAVVCDEADGERSALASLTASNPDMMIVDLNLGDDSGLRLIHRARQEYPALKILVASMYDESMYGERAISAGANGYICKQVNPEKLVEAIQHVLRGELYVSRGLANRMRERELSGAAATPEEPVDLLSERELQVFSLIGNGYATKEIAAKLHVSPKTIDAHRDHIKQKIGAVDNTRLVHRAVEWVLSH